MTVDEIFSKLATHMVEGIMIHDELANAYDFLGLRGFAKCQDYHHIEETNNYRCLVHYYSTHYHKLIELGEIPKPQIIPNTWIKYTTMAVDTNTKRNAVKDMMNKWVEWERDTKKLYQEMRQELCALGEVAAALTIDCFICDVDKELVHAEKKFIKLETLGYDINTIISWQEPIYNKYKKKIGW